MKTISLRMPESLLNAANAFAEKNGIDRTQLIHRALLDYLTAQGVRGADPTPRDTKGREYLTIDQVAEAAGMPKWRAERVVAATEDPKLGPLAKALLTGSVQAEAGRARLYRPTSVDRFVKAYQKAEPDLPGRGRPRTAP